LLPWSGGQLTLTKSTKSYLLFATEQFLPFVTDEEAWLVREFSASLQDIPTKGYSIISAT
jgi:hypothetical protein